MAKGLYGLWFVSASFSGYLIWKLLKGRKKYVEIRDKFKNYGVLGVSDILALGPELNQYALKDFSQFDMKNEYKILIKGKFETLEPYTSKNCKTPLLFHVIA